MKKPILSSFILFSFLVINVYGQTDPSVVRAMHTISSHDILKYVEEQCADKYEGRLTGTEGYNACAQWLAEQMGSWGVKPAGDRGTWFQEYDLPYTTIGRDCGVSLHIPVKKGETMLKHYNYVTEYMPGSTSGSGTVTAEVVYAGYGISAPELGYDDYAGIDVKGKIVLIERESPVGPGAGKEKFSPWYPYSFHQYKIRKAFEKGAVGMLYNYGPIANPNNDYIEGFIYVHVGDTVVNDLFAGTGRTYKSTIEGIDKNLKPASFNTGKKVTIKMDTEHFPNGRGKNIIGIIEGTDPVLKDEAVIIGAHLDHMGMCYDIIQGANDNASAVGVMMAVAKALGENKISLKRTVIFLAFGSEEQGILGAKAYLENPVMPLEKSVLLNMDGVGVGHSIGATAGKDYPLLFAPFEANNNSFIHRPLTANSFPNLGRPRLDAARFLTAGIPSLSFYTYGSTSYYHVPGDNLDIIKPEIMEDMAQLLFLSTVELANSEKPLR